METIGKHYTLEERQVDKKNYYIRGDLLGQCSIGAVITLGVIESEGIMSNKELAELLQVSKKTVSSYLRELRDLGLLRTNISQEEILKQLLLEEKPYVCSWCNMSVNLLEEHHYPIPAREGGTKTVSICPNCHKMFHKIEAYHNEGMQYE